MQKQPHCIGVMQHCPASLFKSLQEKGLYGARKSLLWFDSQVRLCSGPLSLPTKNSPIHHQSFQARMPLSHHRWGRSWKTTAGACLHSVFHEHPIPQCWDFWAQRKTVQFLQKPVCPSFTPPLHFAKPSVLTLGAPLRFRYHHQEYFQLLMGSSRRAQVIGKGRRLHLPFPKQWIPVRSSHTGLSML